MGSPMKKLKVRLCGKFKKTYEYQLTKRVGKGTKVFIDMIEGSPMYGSGLGVRVVNIWKKPKWFDAEWFTFESN
jgi:hypothetical protein